jgi:tetratricopeptide (TPR) repeat protein
MRYLLAALALVILLTGCSTFKPSTQTVSFTCEQKDVVLVVSGQRHNCPTTIEIPRNREFAVQAYKDGYMPYQRTISYHMNESAMLDTIGTAIFLAPVIGLMTPGSRDLDETNIHIILSQSDASPQNKAQNITADKDVQKVSASAYSSKETSAKQFEPEAINWTEKSKKFAASKNWSEMIRMASIAIQIDPSYPEAYVSRSWAYLEKGFPDEALADCQKALELDINNYGAYNNRGRELCTTRLAIISFNMNFL